jgi:hypothetical protein
MKKEKQQDAMTKEEEAGKTRHRKGGQRKDSASDRRRINATGKSLC